MVEFFDKGKIAGAVRVQLILQKRTPPRHQNNHEIYPTGTTITNICSSGDLAPPGQNLLAQGISLKVIVVSVLVGVPDEGGNDPGALTYWESFRGL